MGSPAKDQCLGKGGNLKGRRSPYGTAITVSNEEGRTVRGKLLGGDAEVGRPKKTGTEKRKSVGLSDTTPQVKKYWPSLNCEEEPGLS